MLTNEAREKKRVAYAYRSIKVGVLLRGNEKKKNINVCSFNVLKRWITTLMPH